MPRSLATLSIAVTLALPIAASAGSPPAPRQAALETLLAASASEPSAHRALAEYYRQRASEERARADRLRSAARHLGGGKLFQVSAQKSARLAQAERLDASAREHERLATQHDALAS